MTHALTIVTHLIRGCQMWFVYVLTLGVFNLKKVKTLPHLTVLQETSRKSQSSPLWIFVESIVTDHQGGSPIPTFSRVEVWESELIPGTHFKRTLSIFRICSLSSGVRVSSNSRTSSSIPSCSICALCLS